MKKLVVVFSVVAGILSAVAAATKGTLAGHEGVQLWADGPYWATVNCGAKEVGQAGSYYFNWDDKTGWSVQGGALTGKLVKNSGTTFWSGGWRKPTQEEAAAMGSKCKVVETKEFNGQLCARVCGTTPGYTENSVWFPLAGWGNGGNASTANNFGNAGKYWVEGSGGAILRHLMVYKGGLGTANGGANHGNYYTLRLVCDSVQGAGAKAQKAKR